MKNKYIIYNILIALQIFVALPSFFIGNWLMGIMDLVCAFYVFIVRRQQVLIDEIFDRWQETLDGFGKSAKLNHDLYKRIQELEK